MNNKKKKVIGIDLNQVLRNFLEAFERFYIKEFGDSDIIRPINSLNIKQHFAFKNTIQNVKYLTENAPEKLADIIEKENIFNESLYTEYKKESLTEEEMFKKFLYQDYVLEIFGHCKKSQDHITLLFNKFVEKFSKDHEIYIISQENELSIPSSLVFLSRYGLKPRNIKFTETFEEIWDFCDVYITANEEIIKLKPKNKKVVYVNDGNLKNIKKNVNLLVENFGNLINNVKFVNMLK